jgi:hypothetical protein
LTSLAITAIAMTIASLLARGVYAETIIGVDRAVPSRTRSAPSG